LIDVYPDSRKKQFEIFLARLVELDSTLVA
jgi:hypothetical protein